MRQEYAEVPHDYGRESFVGKIVYVKFVSNAFAIGTLLRFNEVMVIVTDIQNTNRPDWVEDNGDITIPLHKLNDITLYRPKIMPEDLLTKEE